ncbi:MAG: hypothetical protein KDA42_04060 [Planctomycetales bacterium]|nr:hypothetical protein [Planctomycetales bacterium]
MARHLGLLAIACSLLVFNSGCQQESAQGITGDAWEYYAHGDPIVTLNRWARVGMDDNDQIYYVDFHAEDKVVDENLFIVRDLKHLKSLDLGGTKVTDFGMKNLRGLKQLEVLHLPDGITDIGLQDLRPLAGEKMREIFISPESGVTSDGVDQLKVWFPKAKIYYRDIFRL